MGRKKLVLPVKAFPEKLRGFMVPLMLLRGNEKKVLFPGSFEKAALKEAEARTD